VRSVVLLQLRSSTGTVPIVIPIAASILYRRCCSTDIITRGWTINVLLSCVAGRKGTYAVHEGHKAQGHAQRVVDWTQHAGALASRRKYDSTCQCIWWHL
jgi:hypothetical protein